MSAMPAAVAAATVLLVAAALAPTALPRPILAHDRGRPSVRGAVASRLPGRRARQRRAIADGLAELVEGLARSVRAGSSVRGALLAAAAGTDGPLGDDLGRLAGRLHNGAPLTAVLDEWHRERHDIRDIGLVAVALVIAAGSGGSVARALDGVADTIRGEQHLRAEVRALASQAEASAVLVAVLPLAFGVVAGVADPRTVAFLTSTVAGLGCLVVGLGLDLAAWWWMRRITSGIES